MVHGGRWSNEWKLAGSFLLDILQIQFYFFILTAPTRDQAMGLPASHLNPCSGFLRFLLECVFQRTLLIATCLWWIQFSTAQDASCSITTLLWPPQLHFLVFTHPSCCRITCHPPLLSKVKHCSSFSLQGLLQSTSAVKYSPNMPVHSQSPPLWTL